MTRDELIEIIKDEVECNCDNGFMTGMGAAADAILAKLEREQATFNKANALGMQINSEADQYWHEQQGLE